MLLSADLKFLDINVHLLPLLERRRLEEVTKLRKCCPCKNSRAIAQGYELELKFLNTQQQRNLRSNFARYQKTLDLFALFKLEKQRDIVSVDLLKYRLLLTAQIKVKWFETN